MDVRPAPRPAPLVYQTPELYELAFSYRDVPAECAAILSWVERTGGQVPPGRVLELAAGPADHALHLARRGSEAWALDLSAAMGARAEEKAAQAGQHLRVVTADMIDFELPERFDLVLLMLNSVMHIPSLDALIQHFRAVGRHLRPCGVYVMEVQHPKDFVGRTSRPHGLSAPWSVERDGARLTARWGRPEDSYDATRQLFRATVELEIERGAERQRHVETVAMRDWTKDELDAAARLAGALRLIAVHGDFAPDAPFDDSEDSWRMILVFQRA